MGRKNRRKEIRRIEIKPDVSIVGPPVRELVERIRSVLEEELIHKEKRYQDAPTSGLKWNIERYEKALWALEELERRAAK